jgi:hypothetical protein
MNKLLTISILFVLILISSCSKRYNPFKDRDCNHNHKCCEMGCKCCSKKGARIMERAIKKEKGRLVLNSRNLSPVKEQEDSPKYTSEFDEFYLELNKYKDSVNSAPYDYSHLDVSLQSCEKYTLKWVCSWKLSVEPKKLTKKNSKNLCQNKKDSDRINRESSMKKNQYGTVSYTYKNIGNRYIIITSHTATALDRQTSYFYLREE